MEIYGTLGPGCASADTLEQMLRAGMTGVRLNLSHVTLARAAESVSHLHTAAARCGLRPGLLVDLQGPELRVGALAQPLELREGDMVLLGEQLPLPEPILSALKAGQEILLDDGKLLLKAAADLRARVLRGGTLHSRKSVALPGADLRPPTLTEADLENLRCAAKYGVTGVMQPFVRDRADLETVRRALDENGCGQIRLYAKIENMDGVARLDELLPAADEIVIARGDLGNAVALWDLPGIQKRIAARCRSAGKPFMVVTQMLASMERSPVPTRAEVSDVFNAVLDGAASVMVTGETAVGRYPVEAIRYLAETAAAAERFQRESGREP